MSLATRRYHRPDRVQTGPWRAWSANTAGQPSQRETPGQRLWMSFGTGQVSICDGEAIQVLFQPLILPVGFERFGLLSRTVR